MTDKFTTAQLKALNWLPSDGSWRIMDTGNVANGLNSLRVKAFPRFFCEAEYGPFGTRGGHKSRWRLTDAGIEAKRKLTETEK